MQIDSSSQILQQIYCAANSPEGIDYLYGEIHSALGKIIDVNHFSIALLDKETKTLHFPYIADHNAAIKTGFCSSLNNPDFSLIARVLQKKIPTILNGKEIFQYLENQETGSYTPIAKSWLGLPLVIDSQPIGIVVVQSYENEHQFRLEDLTYFSAYADQIALAIDQKQSQRRYQNLIENLNDVVYKTDNQGRFTYISSAITNLVGSTPESLKGIYRWRNDGINHDLYSQFLHPDDRVICRSIFNEALHHQTPFEIEYRLIGRDKSETWVLERGQFLKDEMSKVHLEGFITQIQERKKAEQISKILFAISNAVNTTKSLEELYQTIHKSLLSIANIDHFNIGMFDKANDKISFVYNIVYASIEHPSYILNASRSTSLTAEVIRQKKPLIFSREEMTRFAARKGGKVIGTVTESWLGVPLVVRGEIIGAMLAETIDPHRPYSPMDADWFNSVSEQIAIAIEKKRTEEQIQTREKIITALYQVSNGMHTTDSLKALYQVIFRTMASLIDTKNFSIALYQPETDTITFQYASEKPGHRPIKSLSKARKSGALAYQVIHKGEPLLLQNNKRSSYQPSDTNEVSDSAPAKCWLGVPLKGKKRVLGALINQSFTDSFCYDQADISLLESVSEQIAIAIEYKNAETDLISTQNELIKRAHKAGMADIASDTIHNLGNILNSIKTSNSIVNDLLENSQVENFNRALGMLEEHQHQLTAFVCENPNGEKLLQYLIAMEQSMNNEFSTLKDHSERLSSKIDLMLKVIDSQKSYVHDLYVVEECRLDLIVDQILNMYNALFENLEIKLIRHYDATPTLKLQKTKLEHVLINIINNAREAMDRFPSSQRIITVSISQDPRFIHLRLKDAGEGIAPKHLNRIFSHGFTTKEHGNGFGLHNAVSFLKDMGGKIWAESEGVGMGATFVIQFKTETAEPEAPPLS